MADQSDSATQHAVAIPPDDPRRNAAIARPDSDANLPHIGVVGDTYTLLLTAKDTAGRFCLIDRHVPAGGGLLRIATTSRKPSSSSRASS